MSADDQTFLDTLNAVPNDIKRFSADVADYIEQHIDRAAAQLREALSSQGWLPESARPSPPPPKPPAPRPAFYVGLYYQTQHWVEKHKLLSGACAFGIAATVYFAYSRRRAYTRKRRAKRASNGARLEVVVIAGSPHEPATRSIALDLERRGFIVFIVCSDVEEEVLVQNEARSDIKPLLVDLTHSVTSNNSIERLAQYLRKPQYAFEGARPHHLELKAFIVVASLAYPSAPITTVSPSHISDLLNTRLLHPMLVTQALIPLLTSAQQQHHSNNGPIPPPKVIALTPTIIPSLSPPFHAFESVIVSGLSAFIRSLRAELAPLSVPVTHLRLGSFDYGSLQPRNQLAIHSLQAQRAEMLGWPEGSRQAYGRNYMAVSERGPSGNGAKGSPLRELHNAVFDAMAAKGSRIVRAGAGSLLYEVVGAWVPGSWVRWMMGIKNVERLDLGGFGGSDNGSHSGSEGYKEESGMAGESEYVPVYH